VLAALSATTPPLFDAFPPHEVVDTTNSAKSEKQIELKNLIFILLLFII
jgi:hypothetical protein